MKAKLGFFFGSLVVGCVLCVGPSVHAQYGGGDGGGMGGGGGGGSFNSATGYVQVNLVSDIASNAPHVDSRLINPWGFVVGSQGIWVNGAEVGLMTTYGPSGQIGRGAISVPAPGGGSGAPTG